ncbi:MAG: hypothetical protein SGJ24_09055 [Chloroflexota bacterium]|nr:hypothetical protein [Chloroflexota bacterium]
MKRTLKTIIVAIGAASLLLVGIASAQDVAPVAPDAAAEVRDRRPMHDSELALLVQEYTGLDAAALRQALVGGATLGDLITANGRTTEEFTTAALAIYDSNQVERRSNFETRLTQALSGELRELFGEGRGSRGGRGGMFGGRGGADSMQPEVTPAPGI